MPALLDERSQAVREPRADRWAVPGGDGGGVLDDGLRVCVWGGGDSHL